MSVGGGGLVVVVVVVVVVCSGGNGATAAIRVVLVLGWLTAGLEGTSDHDHPLRGSEPWLQSQAKGSRLDMVLVSSSVLRTVREERWYVSPYLLDQKSKKEGL